MQLAVFAVLGFAIGIIDIVVLNWLGKEDDTVVLMLVSAATTLVVLSLYVAATHWIKKARKSREVPGQDLVTR